MASKVLVTTATYPELSGLYTRDPAKDVPGLNYHYTKDEGFVSDEGSIIEFEMYLNEPVIDQNGIETTVQPFWYLRAVDIIIEDLIGIDIDIYGAPDYSNVSAPWLVSWPDDIVVTQVSLPEPTFGLPEDVVALITSRHGSVANYLRLRNQGQV